MAYIILNGVKSTDITGLLISKLPPISKPKIRVNTTEIDGVDGDIITKLGYSAYDKTISIGLSYNYDLNEVISFFNSDGVVTFSDEPNKYYKYQIINQIDFEKLIRFKTAEVTLHCQPFKYSLEEGTRTYTTSPATITNTGNIYSKPLLSITGTGTINLSLNGNQLFVINLGDTSTTINIDTDLMEAYSNDNILMNRQVTGNYDNFKLNIGSNTITWDGTITSLEISNYSRWV